MAAKVKSSSINRKKISWLLEQDMNVKFQAMQHHLEITRMLINDILEDEVKQYAGQKYQREKPHDGQFSRWGYNPGSVKMGSERIRIDVPRMYDKANNSNKSLETYEKLRELQAVDERVLKAIILGLSTRNYEPVIKNLMDSFGVSHSSVSKDFIEQSSARLEEFENRSLSDYEFVALFIDGKYLAKEQVLIVLGVTLQGEKIPIGFIQTATENSESISELLSNLIERGLNYKHGLLFVIDGSKGIYKAVRKVFSSYAVIQRCQWHKRENVLSYLPEHKAENYRKRMNKAYNIEDYHEAKKMLLETIEDLKVDNMSAARSLKEGLEETLTLHRLGLSENFKRSFSTTNAIENLNSQIGKYLRNVKNWQNSNQRYRWVACALFEIERRMRRVNNYKKLHEMRVVLKQEVSRQKEIIKNVA
jgi:putative transposase